jgi:hypothetical protein
MDSDTRTWERLFLLLAEDNWDQTVYGYRVDQFDKPIKPYLFKWSMHADLIESIRARYGAGLYRLLIREDRTMVFSGTIGIGPPPRQRRVGQ